MAYDFSATYARDPWDTITLNERHWYDPILREMYVRKAVYSKFANMKVDLGAMKTRTITFNDLIPPRPNTAPIGPRDMDASRLYMDSYQKDLTVERHGNGMSVHKESELFSYWERNGNYGLVPIIQNSLGQAIVDHIDLLARNVFFQNPYALFGRETGENFEDITASDKISTQLLDSVWLGIGDRGADLPYVSLPVGPVGDELIVITTRGVIHDLKREIDPNGPSFVESSKYQGGVNLMTGEVGMYRGFRFIENGLAMLWNCGEIIHQAKIVSAVEPGDGAPDPKTTKVNNVRRMGQPDAKHYIEVDDASGFKKNDKVTIHKLQCTRTDGRGVLSGGVNNGGGVDYEDETAEDIEIHAVDTQSNPHRIYLKRPYMYSKGLATDLGGGVYGYVTLARNIHTALFIDPTKNGVIAGVAQPPQIYTPPPVDDFLSIYRITYDFWMKFALWEPEVFEVAFLAGSNKGLGPVYIR